MPSLIFMNNVFFVKRMDCYENEILEIFPFLNFQEPYILSV